jgi:hypothetical protein
MKTILIILTAACIAFSAHADKSVKGYTKKDGTYVEPHIRSSPNKDKSDNFSSKGNTNPYTGKKGYVDPDKPKEKK